MTKKKTSLKKKIGIGAIIISLLIMVSTFFIGNYFVDYALVPQSAGADREPVVESLPEGVEGQPQELAQIIQKNREDEEKYVDEWLEMTKDLVQDVSIKSNDQLTLRGKIYPQSEDKKTNRWAVIVHGYQVDKEHMYPVAHRYWRAGYNILSYDQRSLGTSDGDYITMGIKEKEDLVLWLKELLKKHPDAEIVTHGQSMGSATVMMASGLDNYPRESVNAVIADCGYSSVWGVFASELRQRFNLPAFPFLHMAGVMAYFRADINIFTDGVTTDLLQHSKTPTLFIHGTADDFVPYPMIHELYESLPIKEKEKYIVEGAGHSESKYLNPDEYYQTVFGFIDKYTGKR